MATGYARNFLLLLVLILYHFTFTQTFKLADCMVRPDAVFCNTFYIIKREFDNFTQNRGELTVRYVHSPYKIKDGTRIVCTTADRQCPAGRPRTVFSSTFPTLRFSKLTIERMQVEYVSNSFFRIFPELEVLEFRLSKQKLSEIPNPFPFSKKLHKIIIEDSQVRALKKATWNSPVENLNNFEINYHQKKGNPGDSLLIEMVEYKNVNSVTYKLVTLSNDVKVSLPKFITPPTNGFRLILSYKGNSPDQLAINYDEYASESSYISLTFENGLLPQTLSNLAPKRSGIQLSNLQLMINNGEKETYAFIRNNIYDEDNNKNNVHVLQEEDDQKFKEITSGSQWISETGEGTKTNPKTVDAVIFDLKDFLQKIDATKAEHYIINTQILFLQSGLTVNHKPFYLTIRYNFIIKAKKAFYYDFTIIAGTNLMKTNMDYKSGNVFTNFQYVSDLMNLYKNFHIHYLYSILFGIVEIAKPRIIVEATDSFRNTQKIVRERMLDVANINEIKQKVADNAKQHQRHYIENVMNTIHEVVEFVTTETVTGKTIPRLSPEIYKEKTVIHQEVAKSLISLESFDKVLRNQKMLLKISKLKSNNMMKIAQVEVSQINNKIRNERNAASKMKSMRVKYEEEAEAAKKDFMDAMKKRQEEAIAEAVFGIFEAVGGIFKGGGKTVISIHTTIKRLTEKIKKLEKSLSKIQKLVKKLKWIIVEVTKKLSKTMSMAKDAGDSIINAQRAYGTMVSGFDPGEAVEFTRKVRNLDAADVLEWDIAKMHVLGVMDASLTSEIGEAATYKAALLKMISAGKAETQTIMRLALAESDAFLAQYKVGAFQKESEYIEEAIPPDNSKDYQDNLQLSIKQLKLDVFLHLNGFCLSSFYFTLQECHVFSQFSFDSTLTELLHLMNRIQLDTIEQTAELYPPPQSFIDKTIQINDEEMLKDFRQNGNLFFSVPIDEKSFSHFDRVRVEEVKVILNGIKLSTPFAQVLIENEGVVQDRLQNKSFVFLGEKWNRIIQYEVNPQAGKERKFLVKGDIHQSFSGDFNIPTLFTTWMISVEKDDNPGLDVTGVSSIDVKFSGSLMLRDNVHENPTAQTDYVNELMEEDSK